MKSIHFITPILNEEAYRLLLIKRPYKTEIRLCNCEMQSCKGRYIVKETSTRTVCLLEALRTGQIINISEYYE